MEIPSLLSRLRELEAQMLLPEVRSDPDRLGALLHTDFVEVGASGRTYAREEVLTEFKGHAPPYRAVAQDFSCVEVAPGCALMRFRTAHVEADGQLTRHVARTSLWLRTGDRWRIRFHQGTPTEPFARHAD